MFSNPEKVQYVLNSLVFRQEHHWLIPHVFVIMENHLHMGDTQAYGIICRERVLIHICTD